MALPIEDYAMAGGCKTAALVGRDGSIDWLCWPRFDSAACFAALLGTPENGRWLIAPRCTPLDVKRRYRPGTLVLETEFQTEAGSAMVVDFMPPLDGDADLVRIVIGRSGQVMFRTEIVVRFDYGATVPWVTRTEDGTIDAIAGPERLILRTPADSARRRSQNSRRVYRRCRSVRSLCPVLRALIRKSARADRSPQGASSLLKNREIGSVLVFLPWDLGRSGCCERTLTYAASSLGMRIRL